MEAKPPKSPAYRALLKAGPNLKALQQVHAHIVTSGSHRSRSLLTKLITLACEAGSILYAHNLFLSVPHPDSFLFNSVINSSSKFGFPQYTLSFYRSMLAFAMPPSSYTFTSVIKACADLSALKLGQGVHSHVFRFGCGSERFVQAALVSLYAKCGEFRVARKVFDEMPGRTLVGWNSMISGYEQNGFPREAIEVFKEMRESGVEPDSTGFVNVLAACSRLENDGLGCAVHDEVVRRGLEINVPLGTSLINMYARCGDVRKAREVFECMDERNVVTWTAMISGYATNGYGSQAMELFGEMRARGPRPNTVTFVAVLTACAHAGLVKEGRQAYASMRQEYGLVPGVEHRVCLVDMLGRSGLLDEAYQFIKELSPEEAAPPIWTAMLGACKMHKNTDLGVTVAEHLLEVEPENPGHYVNLSNIYALAGRMDRVEKVRNMMKERREAPVHSSQLKIQNEITTTLLVNKKVVRTVLELKNFVRTLLPEELQDRKSNPCSIHLEALRKFS
ncbi:hypothetical protein ACLB2K_035715 [Fragaria x ananassa]